MKGMQAVEHGIRLQLENSDQQREREKKERDNEFAKHKQTALLHETFPVLHSARHHIWERMFEKGCFGVLQFRQLLRVD